MKKRKHRYLQEDSQLSDETNQRYQNMWRTVMFPYFFHAFFISNCKQWIHASKEINLSALNDKTLLSTPFPSFFQDFSTVFPLFSALLANSFFTKEWDYKGKCWMPVSFSAFHQGWNGKKYHQFHSFLIQFSHSVSLLSPCGFLYNTTCIPWYFHGMSMLYFLPTFQYHGETLSKCMLCDNLSTS